MKFEEIGTIFKEEREKRGLSIKEVMEVTKISRRNIIALEEGNKDDLPHPVYAKGFVRSYARFLGLDGDELARVFDSDLEKESEELDATQYDVTPGTDLAFQEGESGMGTKKSRVPAVLLIVVLLGILGGLVYYFGFHSPAPTTVEAPAVESGSQEAIQSSEAPQGAPGAVEAAPVEQPDAVEQAGSDAGAAAQDREEAVSLAPAKEAVPAEQSVAEKDSEEGDAYRHTLVIRAVSDEGCWIGVWKEEGQDMARDFFLRKGEPLRLMFNSYRRIRIGNVPGVTIQYNGNPYPMEEAKGKTQDLRFGKQ
ncbi:RodZ domain-containing protein [Salidesulfovibrio onnuriiensis]|uniref:RodZ domain-containing protein n=1 Tax=Salidesulfovibrio onnuriiensis TaxID=2583823 RepID=UPI0011C7714F|nr:RodZ domain-containing protein [Salidesulfovibrio onnuriiensis]